MGPEASVYVYNNGQENYAINFAQLTQKEGTEGKSYEIIFTNSVKEQAPEIAPTGKTAIYRNYPVKTEDVAPIAVLAAMSGISAGVLTAVERWKRKKEN